MEGNVLAFYFLGLFCLAMRTCTALKLKFFRVNLNISIERNDFSWLNINPECFCFVPIIALSVFVIMDWFYVIIIQVTEKRFCFVLMEDRISELSDDILSFILSFLTMRDAVKTRLLSHRWRYLSPPLSHLQFDVFTLFGTHGESSSKFIAAVDQVLLACRGPKIGTLKVRFGLGDDYAFHVDRWVSFSSAMQVEKIAFNFSCSPESCGSYNFPYHILPTDEASHLKHLCLVSCTLRLSPEFTSQLNPLRTLDLDCVPLDWSSLDIITSACPKLTLLRMIECGLPKIVCIHGQLLCLKTLIIHDSLISVELKSINLEIFEFFGRPRKLTFVDVPHLKKALVWSLFIYRRASPICNALAKDLPQLQFLSLIVQDEVHQGTITPSQVLIPATFV